MSRISDFSIQNAVSLISNQVFVLDANAEVSLYEAFNRHSFDTETTVNIHRIHHADNALAQVSHNLTHCKTGELGVAVLAGSFAVPDFAADLQELASNLKLNLEWERNFKSLSEGECSVPLVLHISIDSQCGVDVVKILRNSGFLILCSGFDARERQEMAIFAHFLSAAARVPVAHLYDFSRPHFSYFLTDSFFNSKMLSSGLTEISTANFDKFHLYTYSAISDLVTTFKSDLPTLRNLDDVVQTFDRISDKLFAQKYKIFHYCNDSNCNTEANAFLASGESLSTNSGTNSIVFRVYPRHNSIFTKSLCSNLPASLRSINVLDIALKTDPQWGPLYLDLRASLPESIVLNGKLCSIAETFQLHKHINLHSFRVENIKSSYLQLLHTVFKDKLFLVDVGTSNSIWNDASSIDGSLSLPQTGYGIILDEHRKREHFTNSVRDFLSSSSPMSSSLRSAATKWLASSTSGNNNQDDEKCIAEFRETMLAEAAAISNSLKLEELVKESGVLSQRSFWLIGEDEWSFDISISGIHDILKSKKNVNILVIDTTPYEELQSSSGGSRVQRKKDLGLYGMNYGDVYVGSIALYSNYSHVLQVFNEADSFDGPSLIIAYAPNPTTNHPRVFSEPASSVIASLKDTKKAVDQGLWPLYRWNPELEKQGQDPFTLDSTYAKSQLQKFLDRRNQFISIVSTEPQIPKYLSQTLDFKLKESTRSLQESFAVLASGVSSGQPLMILFASDGGNGEEVAQRLLKEGTGKGLRCQISSMDEFSLEELADEPTVVFVVSTAGQGEFPENGKETWKKLKQAADESYSLDRTQFAVFALGDSHYWPRPGEEKYFCKSGKDLEEILLKLGGNRLIEIGLGDDQHEDKFNTALGPWKQNLWNVLGVGGIVTEEEDVEKLPADDVIKRESNYLRGTIAQGLVDESTGGLALRDTKLTKFHGIYQQDDRDIRDSRRRQGLEKAYSFMIRVRVPGGGLSANQYKSMDDIANHYAMQTMKLTTRQTVQFHGVIKRELKKTIQEINKAVMDTIAACGDVCRNVMCNVNPTQSSTHNQVYEFAKALSAHLTPNTSAYHEIWLDDVKVAGEAVQDCEPLYGPTYLPRKFKVAVAIPPLNDADVFTNCLGYIAIVDKNSNKLIGYNVTVGGGLGTTHNNPKTYPCLAQVMGFVTPDKAIDVGEKVMLVQRDFGDRVNRKHARLKYTLRDMGMDKFRSEVEARCGYKLEPAREYYFESNIDRLGWTRNAEENTWNYTLFVQNGRIRDWPDYQLKTGLRKISEIHLGSIRFTGNQNLMLASIPNDQKSNIQSILDEFKMSNEFKSGLRLNSMACTALPTCGLALAESERYLPDLITKLEVALEKVGLREEDITIRMTGCPNGCARPFASEIGLVGRAPGIYNLHIGGGFNGERLNTLYKDGVNEQEIIASLSEVFTKYAEGRLEGEKFGDFAIRIGLVSITSH